MPKKHHTSLAEVLLKVPELISGKLRTLAAKANAETGIRFRVSAPGRVYNGLGERSRISIGDHAHILGEVLVFSHAGRIKIGDWFYCGPRSMIWSSDACGIHIGNRVQIASDVIIFDNNTHPTDAAERFKQVRAIMTTGHPRDIDTIRSAPVVIGDDVWLATRVTVLKGVTIGDGAVIGTGSIICADVKAGARVPAGTVIRSGTQE